MTTDDAIKLADEALRARICAECECVPDYVGHKPEHWGGYAHEFVPGREEKLAVALKEAVGKNVNLYANLDARKRELQNIREIADKYEDRYFTATRTTAALAAENQWLRTAVGAQTRLSEFLSIWRDHSQWLASDWDQYRQLTLEADVARAELAQKDEVL